MVVHYPRTVWKNSDAEHEVTGKTYNLVFYWNLDLSVGSTPGVAMLDGRGSLPLLLRLAGSLDGLLNQFGAGPNEK